MKSKCHTTKLNRLAQPCTGCFTTSKHSLGSGARKETFHSSLSIDTIFERFCHPNAQRAAPTPVARLQKNPLIGVNADANIFSCSKIRLQARFIEKSRSLNAALLFAPCRNALKDTGRGRLRGLSAINPIMKIRQRRLRSHERSAAVFPGEPLPGSRRHPDPGRVQKEDVGGRRRHRAGHRMRFGRRHHQRLGTSAGTLRVAPGRGQVPGHGGVRAGALRARQRLLRGAGHRGRRVGVPRGVGHLLQGVLLLLPALGERHEARPRQHPQPHEKRGGGVVGVRGAVPRLRDVREDGRDGQVEELHGGHQRLHPDDPAFGPALVRLLPDDGGGGNVDRQLLHHEQKFRIHFHENAQRLHGCRESLHQENTAAAKK
ncbi:hypothetical protein CEXT_245301 [Caerostris extrusa]|uniref:Uncharacterized protein n=1 Tax=Caerostris extrusa TaxID=172846 RepID=A0AAV4QEI7_CAEEX|nr:hypothetical protein CEXT_245301 [Caerostris extrusa]